MNLDFPRHRPAQAQGRRFDHVASYCTQRSSYDQPLKTDAGIARPLASRFHSLHSNITRVIAHGSTVHLIATIGGSLSHSANIGPFSTLVG